MLAHAWPLDKVSSKSVHNFLSYNAQQEILIETNVLLVHSIFFCILLCAFSFLSTCIRDLASIWDETNIILIVTDVEVVIGNCLPVYLAPLWRYGASMIMGSGPWPFGVTWPWRHRSRDHSTPGGRLPMEIWPSEVLPERLFQEQRSVVSQSSVGPQYYTDLIYSSLLC